MKGSQVQCRLDYNSLLKMKKISLSEGQMHGSPGDFTSNLKEDAEDRLATRNSLQMTSQQECLEGRRSKRKKLHVVQHSKRHSWTYATDPVLEEADQEKTIPPASHNQNQRITFQKQSANKHQPKVQTENRAKRNKIFSHSYLVKRYSLEFEPKGDLLQDKSITKRPFAKPEFIQKQRWVLQEINTNPPEDYLTIVKGITGNEKAPQDSNILLSYPKFIPEIASDGHITPNNIKSRIQRLSLDKTERLVFADEGQKHVNPATKKIRHLKSKRKTPRCSFSKLTLEKQQTGHRNLGSDSRASHCLLPECLIKDNLANYNIKVVDSCSSEEEDGQRYFDTEASPIRQKISYRNIDIQHSTADEVVQQLDEGHHNLFSDFEFPPTPRREQERSSRKQFTPKSTCKVLPLAVPKRQWHSYLIGIALLLLIIQLIG